MGPGVGPRGAPAIEVREGALVGVLGEGRAGGEEGGAEGGAGVVVPDLGDRGALGLAGGAGPDLRACDAAEREAGEAEPEREGSQPTAREPALEVGEEVVHAGVAVLGAAGEASRERAAEPARDPEARADELAGEDRVHELDDGAAAEGALAVEGLPEGDAEGELVGAGVDLAGLPLLGRHVEGGAEERTGAGEVPGEVARGGLEGGGGLVALADSADEAEVHDARAAVGADHHVVGLEVAVDEAGAVGRGEAAGGGEEDREDLRERARALGEPGAGGEAVDELHGDEEAVALVQADVVDGDDVGVGELGEAAGLAEHAGALVLAGAGEEELEGDLAVELGVVCGVDGAHAPGPEQPEDHIAADEAAPHERHEPARPAGGGRRVARREGPRAADAHPERGRVLADRRGTQGGFVEVHGAGVHR